MPLPTRQKRRKQNKSVSVPAHLHRPVPCRIEYPFEVFTDLVCAVILQPCLCCTPLAGDVFYQLLNAVVLLVLREIECRTLCELQQQLIEQGAGEAELLHLLLEDLNKRE